MNAQSPGGAVKKDGAIRPLPREKRNASVLARALRVIRQVVNLRQPITQLELAKLVDLPPPTLSRVLADLEEQGWIVQDRERCRIEVGPALIGVSAAIVHRYNLEETIRPVLKALVEEVGETVCLHQYDPIDEKIVAYLVEESDWPLQYHLPPGEASFLHAGAAGRAVLAFLPEEAKARGLELHGLPKLTRGTITDLTHLLRELEWVQKAGYAISRGERYDDGVGIAAPVFGADGKVLGSLQLAIPAVRFDGGDQERFGRCVIASAEKIAPMMDTAARTDDSRTR